MRIGVVADTHGYLNPKVSELLQGVEYILHAGDIGGGGIIDQLSRIAPVTVVKGNIDRTSPESGYPGEVLLELAGHKILLTHQVQVPKGEDDPKALPFFDSAVDIVVSGHSHIALERQLGSVLFFNPGAAGKRRFKLVPSIGFLDLVDGGVRGTIVPL